MEVISHSAADGYVSHHVLKSNTGLPPLRSYHLSCTLSLN
jgi:hypothetical protein